MNSVNTPSYVDSPDKLFFPNGELCERSQQALSTFLPGTNLVSAEFLSEGRINSIFTLRVTNPDRKIVLRLRTLKDYNYEKGIIKDKMITDMVSKHVRTPEVLAEDASKTIFPCEFTLLEFVEGEVMSKREMLPAEAAQAGQTLAEIHKTKLENFRTFDQRLEQGSTNWKDFYFARLQVNIAKVAKVDPLLAGKLESFFAANLRYIPEDTKPTLTHHDFHAGNLVKMPTGEMCVLDWDAASIEVPGIDLIKIKHLNFRNNLKLYLHFLSGYRANRKKEFTPILNNELRVYETLWLLRAFEFESTHVNPDPSYFPTTDYYRERISDITDQTSPETLLGSIRRGMKAKVTALSAQ